MPLLRCVLILLLAAPAPAAVRAARGPRVSPFPGKVAFHLNETKARAIFAAAHAPLQREIARIVERKPSERTFSNTAVALAQALSDFHDQLRPHTFLGDVAPDKTTRDAAELLEGLSTAAAQELYSRKDLFKIMVQLANHGGRLARDQQQLLDHLLSTFAYSGTGLKGSVKKKSLALQKALSRLEQDFDRNVRETKGGLIAAKKDLDGLPAANLELLGSAGPGKVKVGLKYPEYLPFMKTVKDPELRKELDRQYGRIGGEENVKVFEEALETKHRLAGLFGIDYYASIGLAGTMAETIPRIAYFLRGLSTLLEGKVAEENAELLAAKRREHPEADKLEHHDILYYRRKVKTDRFKFDSEKIREYLPVDRVLAGTFKFYSKHFDVEFKEVPAKAWHKDVRLIQVIDKGSGLVAGHIFLDLYPRDGKYNHMAAYPIIQGRELPDGTYRAPAAALVGNFAKGGRKRPALLSPSDVETIFHEFGHLMHGILTQVRYAHASGTSVSTDWVEALSQVMELFLQDPEVFRSLTGHYLSGEPMPEELAKSVAESRSFHQASKLMRHIALSSIDVMYHTEDPPVDTTKIFREVFEAYGLVPPQEGTFLQAGFTHLMGGYGARFYSYIWSRVLAHAIYAKLKKDGLDNPLALGDFRRVLYERGAAQPASELIREFLGGEPTIRPFLESLGLSMPEGRTSEDVNVFARLGPPGYGTADQSDPSLAPFFSKKDGQSYLCGPTAVLNALNKLRPRMSVAPLAKEMAVLINELAPKIGVPVDRATEKGFWGFELSLLAAARMQMLGLAGASTTSWGVQGTKDAWTKKGKNRRSDIPLEELLKANDEDRAVILNFQRVPADGLDAIEPSIDKDGHYVVLKEIRAPAAPGGPVPVVVGDPAVGDVKAHLLPAAPKKFGTKSWLLRFDDEAVSQANIVTAAIQIHVP